MSASTDRRGNLDTGGESGTYTQVGAVRFYGYNTAITANSTSAVTADGTIAPAGSRGATTHATGRSKAFYSDGTLWQYEAVS